MKHLFILLFLCQGILMQAQTRLSEMPWHERDSIITAKVKRFFNEEKSRNYDDCVTIIRQRDNDMYNINWVAVAYDSKASQKGVWRTDVPSDSYLYDVRLYGERMIFGGDYVNRLVATALLDENLDVLMTSMTDDARRRLKAIEAFSDLGSGFNIAMQDLDIRGAGNLLGAEQSGFISDMGLETYQKILSEAMEELGVETGIAASSKADTYVSDCMVDTDLEALIPDSYINVSSEKIRIYKELDSISDDREIERMRQRMEDRFGRMPEETSRLFDIVKIRNLGERLGFEKIIIKNGIMIAFFIMNPLSKYYRSRKFSDVLDAVNRNSRIFELKQPDNRLRLVVRNIPSVVSAYNALKKLA